MKYLVRERAFGLGEDFWIEDELGNRAFFCDARAERTLALRDPDGRELATAHKRSATMRDTMAVDRAGARVATVRRAPGRFAVEFPDGRSWTVRGPVTDHEYQLEDEHGRPVAEVSHRGTRPAYTVALDPYRTDVPLVLAATLCIDALAACGR